jgi:YYY domain-containing protein
VFYVVIWWLIVGILGWLVWPLAFRLFSNLPDRGYAFVKSLGLLLVSYVFWLLSSGGFLSNTWGGIAFAALVVAALSIAYYRWRGAGEETGLREWLRVNWRPVLAVELVFAVAFGGWALYRAYTPDIAATEKPMEFAFLNAILRSDRFPPYDPWMSGYAISYYHFGYVMIAMLTRLSGVPSSHAFNLGIALLFALAATGAYGVVYNLVAAASRGRGRAIGYGVLGGVFVVLIGNLEGAFEAFYSRGLGSPAFWEWLDVKELVSRGQVTGRWFDMGGGWWWWRASRVIHDKTLLGISQEVIDEFPFFSFILGDMHPHVLALPFVILSLALALNLLRGRHAPDWAEYGLYAVCLGGLGFLNTWDFPIYLFVTVVAYAVNRYQHWRRLSQDWLREVISCAIILLGLGLLLYAPFWATFRSQAGGVLPNLFNITRLHQYLLMFGMFIFVILVFLITLVVDLWRTGCLDGTAILRQGLPLWAMVAMTFPLLLVVSIVPLALTAGGRQFVQGVLNSEAVRAVLGEQTLGSLLNKTISLRLADPWMYLALSALVSLVIFLVLRILSSQKERAVESDDQQPSSSNLFALIMIVTGLLLTFVVEFVYLRDTFGTRMNTIFKFYYQAWVLLGLASAYGVWYVLENGGETGQERRTGWGRYVFGVGCVLLLTASLVYTVTAGYNKAGEFKSQPTLDGLAYVRRYELDEYAAIQWLNAHGAGNPVIAEAVGGSFTNFARISSRTGLPTVLGWSGHELQWRGSGEESARRERDVDEIYSGQDFQRTLDLLEEYDVTYVYVGPLERGKYSAVALEKFDTLMDIAFQQGTVTIYQRRPGLYGG